MNLLSLPQEMLASVCKYSDVLTLAKCRKLSSVMDKTARRYDLNLFKLKYLWFNIGNDHIQINLRTFDGFSTTEFFDIQEDIEATLIKCVEKYMSAIRYTGVLEIAMKERRSCDLVLSDEFFNVLIKKSRNKGIRQLRLHWMNVNAKCTVLKHFLRVFRSNSLNITGCKPYKENFFEQLFTGLSLKTFRCSHNRIPPKIADFIQLFAVNIPQVLDIYDPLPLAELVNLLMDISRNYEKVHYAFGAVEYGDLSEDEVKKLAEPLRVFGQMEYSPKQIHIKNDNNQYIIIKGL